LNLHVMQLMNYFNNINFFLNVELDFN